MTDSTPIMTETVGFEDYAHTVKSYVPTRSTRYLYRQAPILFDDIENHIVLDESLENEGPSIENPSSYWGVFIDVVQNYYQMPTALMSNRLTANQLTDILNWLVEIKLIKTAATPEE